MHLLACMLARSWTHTEATAIWVELVAIRKKDIERHRDSSQLRNMVDRVAAQQEISRPELAKWDASARAWLLSADEVEKSRITQLKLTTRDCGIIVGSSGSTYASVIELWTTAMRSLQNLVLGMPHSQWRSIDWPLFMAYISRSQHCGTDSTRQIQGLPCWTRRCRYRWSRE